MKFRSNIALLWYVGSVIAMAGFVLAYHSADVRGVFRPQAPTSASAETTTGTLPNSLDADAEEPLTIIFAGDLMQHKPQVDAALLADGTYDYSGTFRHVTPMFRDADIVVVNLETTLAASPPFTGYPLFRSPATLASDMRDAGIDMALMANNHVCDNGATGIDTTIAELDAVGIRRTGAFRDSVDYSHNNPLIIRRRGFDVAILNYTFGTNGMPVPRGRIVNTIDTATMAREVASVPRNDSTLLFVCLHWGQEYTTVPTAHQRELAGWLHEKGVDYIIGGHPHVVEPLDVERDSAGRVTGLTAWSLGNFVSNQPFENTDGGMMVKLEIERGARVAAKHLFCWVYKPVVNGRREFEIIPSPAADSLLSGDAKALEKYHSFVDKARRIVGPENRRREITRGESLLGVINLGGR